MRQNATGANNGQSWANAYTDLHKALDIAQPGDAIWVAEGNYIPDAGSDRNRVFSLKSGVKLFGGFAGSENEVNQRNIEAHPSILNGNIGDPNDSTDNSYTLLYLDHPDTSTLVDGFTFRHGYAKSDTNFYPTWPTNSGGAVYVNAVQGKGLPVFANCAFKDNYAVEYGGAFYVNAENTSGSTPVFRHCVFFNNRAGYQGGAVYISGGNSFDRGFEMDHCSFDLNSAGRDGGTLYWANAFGPETINFQACSITRSSASWNGPIMYMWRTGTNPFKITIDSCLFRDCFDSFEFNTTYYLIDLDCNPNPRQVVFRFLNSTFEDNHGRSISGISVQNSDGQSVPDTFHVINNIFSKNDLSSIIGAGSTNGEAIVEGNLFYQNYPSGDYPYVSTALGVGGLHSKTSNNVFIENDRPLAVSPYLSPTDAKCEVFNNLIVRNKRRMEITCPDTNRIIKVFNNIFLDNTIDTFVDYIYVHYTKATTQYFNNIFAGNKSSETGLPTLPIRFEYDTLDFAYNSFDTDFFCNAYPNITCGQGNLFGLDPAFRDTANGDYSLSPCSPLRNKGSNAAAAGILTDFNGNPRIQEAIVDIGAFETPGLSLSSASKVQPACAGFNNGSINLSPENACEPVTYQWSPQEPNSPALTGLAPGQYLVTILDGQGRQINDTFLIAEAPQPTPALNSSDVHCVDGLGGSVTAIVTSGTPPFHYQWSPTAADTASLSHLPPGNYALTLSDANGCLDSASVLLRLDGALSLMVDGQAISCHGAADAWLSATPVTGGAPFTWQWQGWPGMDSVAAPLGPGQYAVTVSDVYGCTAAFSFPPTVDPVILSVIIASQPQTDPAQPNGSVMSQATGGTPDYQYLWSTGDTVQNLTGLTSGVYTLSVGDAHGCTFTTEVEVKLMLGTEEAEGQAFLVYPNPSADWVSVAAPGISGAFLLEISDLHGRILISREVFSGQRIGLAELPAGVYLLRARVRERVVFGDFLEKR